MIVSSSTAPRFWIAPVRVGVSSKLPDVPLRQPDMCEPPRASTISSRRQSFPAIRRPFVRARVRRQSGGSERSSEEGSPGSVGVPSLPSAVSRGLRCSRAQRRGASTAPDVPPGLALEHQSGARARACGPVGDKEAAPGLGSFSLHPWALCGSPLLLLTCQAETASTPYVNRAVSGNPRTHLVIHPHSSKCFNGLRRDLCFASPQNTCLAMYGA